MSQNTSRITPGLVQGGLVQRKSKSKQTHSPADSDPADGKKRKLAATSESGAEAESRWLPPQDQKGDGKTHLNAKFGY